MYKFDLLSTDRDQILRYEAIAPEFVGADSLNVKYRFHGAVLVVL